MGALKEIWSLVVDYAGRGSSCVMVSRFHLGHGHLEHWLGHWRMLGRTRRAVLVLLVKSPLVRTVAPLGVRSLSSGFGSFLEGEATIMSFRKLGTKSRPCLVVPSRTGLMERRRRKLRGPPKENNCGLSAWTERIAVGFLSILARPPGFILSFVRNQVRMLPCRVVGLGQLCK